jgi:hypothetical protein
MMFRWPENAEKRTGAFEEMLRAPLKAVVRRTGLDRIVDDRSMELPSRSEATMVDVTSLGVVSTKGLLTTNDSLRKGLRIVTGIGMRNGKKFGAVGVA